MESGEQRFVLKVNCAQCFKELNNCWVNFKKTFNGNQVAEVSKHFTQFGILHKINIQGFNSKQSYLEKLQEYQILILIYVCLLDEDKGLQA